MNRAKDPRKLASGRWQARVTYYQDAHDFFKSDFTTGLD